MSLVPLLTSDQFSSADQPALAQGVKNFGEVLNTWAGIGNSPGLFAKYLPFLGQLNGPGALDQRVKELVGVRVAVLNHCRYTASHRCTSALSKGVGVDELAAVANGKLEGFTEQERLALQLAEEMTVVLPTVPVESNPTGVSGSVRDDVQQVFDAAALVELVMCISVWNALSRFHRVMDFELDMPEAPAPVAAQL
ncbi:carboxymuconolactone decarboxylase family protein (plasmid) [Streptomyces sp. NBC_01340]|uniref:carboxymuconolactone decarboxylase family protein n=1 Tax=unclassified Streptomyces TaxID=2593676 RepID=UPI0022543E60|nr:MULTISPECIES: carboxymuconolactone decarboxylase family protein [unclassified Streptomyces]MCX4460843.1 carboxymuconolactone decarboxylase family protein [Streptomyces sp. NBC_01719]MCX4499827.1 carboxymuconolactone decarboxylase family protein [Streptomyces sp. NBC_01728]MCX4597722.1 carboxymuconolactone decarboxylase family protein [Streptomyces sp. NBC_01549]WSI44959.1 carboxymuconolactone decarboxylase family protein [Streptomyces sp. NBC_01340]